MKIAKRLLPFLLVILAAFFIGCSHTDKKEVKEVITKELDLLKNLDSDTTQKYVSYQELFPDTDPTAKLSDEVNEVFSLFFRNFDYKILDIDVNKDKETAAASVRLCTLEAHSLARDFSAACLKSEILKAAADSENTQETMPSISERYLLLNHLLKTKEYDMVEDNCTITLSKKEDTWEINRTYSLENDLVGGLISYLSDPDILSPEDTLDVYLKTLKKMDSKEMSNYLGLESILTDEDPAKQDIAEALAEQVHQNFNYEIEECTINGYRASIKTKIITFDSDAILEGYQEELNTYLSSPEAVIDGAQKRYQKSLELLLDYIENNEKTTDASTEFHLINDGVSWKLQDTSQELGNAIFGTLSTTPVDETDAQTAE